MIGGCYVVGESFPVERWSLLLMNDALYHKVVFLLLESILLMGSVLSFRSGASCYKEVLQFETEDCFIPNE